jgi:hypothetical protein
MPQDYIQVEDEDVRDVLLALAYGWSPLPLDLGEVSNLRFNETEPSEVLSTLGVRDGRLVVALANAGIPRSIPFSLNDFRGELRGGVCFQGEGITRVTNGYNPSAEAAYWRIYDGHVPRLWIGELGGTGDLEGGGNTAIERIRVDGLRSGARQHFRLRGVYEYYLVRAPNRDSHTWRILVCTDGGEPDRDVLWREFLALQFVLGRQMKIPFLIGVTSIDSAVAMMSGIGDRRNLEPNDAVPVPIYQDNEGRVEECWTAAFFARICRFLVDEPKMRLATNVALETYLAAMTGNLDADYLRLHVGLEAFAYWLMKCDETEDSIIVKDKKSWKAWVKDNEQVIRSHARTGYEESLLNKIRGVYRLATSRVVPSAFLSRRVSLTEDMLSELEHRDTVVHQGLMSPDAFDGKREYRRVGLVRTMFVAIVAKAVRYEGAINGWEIGELGRSQQPDGWWAISEIDRADANRSYFAEK